MVTLWPMLLIVMTCHLNIFYSLWIHGHCLRRYIFFLPPSHVIIPRIGTSQEGTAGSIGVITIMAIYQL